MENSSAAPPVPAKSGQTMFVLGFPSGHKNLFNGPVQTLVQGRVLPLALRPAFHGIEMSLPCRHIPPLFSFCLSATLLPGKAELTFWLTSRPKKPSQQVISHSSNI